MKVKCFYCEKEAEMIVFRKSKRTPVCFVCYHKLKNRKMKGGQNDRNKI